MIRVRIELVPAGVNELTITGETIVIACKYPLDNPESQDMMVFSEKAKGYAEIEGYNLQDTIYAANSTEQDYIELVRLALNELEAQKTTREDGVFFPGMSAYKPAEFDQAIEQMVSEFPEIESIRLFGRRAGGAVTVNNFATDLAVYNKKTPGIFDGGFLLANYPDYVPYFLAVRLDPGMYQKKIGKMNAGSVLEITVQRHCGKNTHPHISDMTCFSGMMLFYQRPDGSISIPANDVRITTRKNAVVKMGEFEHDYSLAELKAEIKAGSLIYSKRRGLFAYPGVKD